MGSLAQHLPVIIVLCSVLTVLAVGLGVLTYYRLEIKVWLFSHWGVRLCASGKIENLYLAKITNPPPLPTR